MRRIALATLLVIPIAFLGVILINCEGSETAEVSYSRDIDPIFSRGTYNCKYCHTGENESQLDLNTYKGLMGESQDGVVVKAYNSENSLLYQKLVMDYPPDGGDRMPKGGPYLTSAELRLIRDWIDQGAKDN